MLYVSLICNLGMSTSMLIDKMDAYAKSKGIEADFEALPFGNLGQRIHKTNILLIGPQVRHMLKKFQDQYSGIIPVIQVMNMSDYALLKVDKIFDRAYEEYRQKANQ